MARVNERNPADAFDAFADSTRVGDVVTGKVTSVVQFGVFVEVAPQVEGLLHSSEMATPLAMGDEVKVAIHGVDHEARRISLSLA